ncbi:hypothetical protein [Alteromonas sp. 14N.309.X.WAT.G.H12]|uniref:hypothetical protein n=1 Tax=Alteromonas sp. 14N.309.X.WAT.G.H12 TaxID=3120824 RepID=UPI002FD39444
MSNFWGKLGFSIEKRTFEPRILTDEEKRERNEEQLEYDNINQKLRKETAKLYSSIIPKALIIRLMEFNDYTCTQWGSRKFARLVNLARNIIDIEVHSEEGFTFEPATRREEQRVILKLNMLMALFFPIPLKVMVVDPEIEDKFKKLFKKILIDELSLLSPAEYAIFEDGVFLGVKCPPGNVILDVFHDALRFEEAQFGYRVNTDAMRTQLGKSPTFTSKAKKASEQNITPGWLFEFQNIHGVDGFFNEEKAIKDNAAMEEDGIS